MTDWAKLTGYDPKSGLTLEEHLAEQRANQKRHERMNLNGLAKMFETLGKHWERKERERPPNPEELGRIEALNPAFSDIDWGLWEPSDEERSRILVETQKFLTSPPDPAPWTYVTLQVSGGDVTGVHRPPADED